MSSEQSLDVGRALGTVLAVAVLGTVVGYFQQGSIAGGLRIGVTVAVGVGVGIVLLQAVTRYLVD
ncbi:hypothetical protein [Haloarcula marina]|uniref:hypothetical protein n=1 Tax=Haloarcula marina TaxID=2961574 RepID=UPI0020B7D290|nr:hypothetical protein [Halomicroarcula marina]